jgi:hypothetical protein
VGTDLRNICPPEGAMTRHERLRRLERQHLVDLAARMGAPHGLSAAVVLQEVRRILSLPDPDQRAFFADLYARLTDAEARELDAIRARRGRILRREHLDGPRTPSR